MLTPKITIEIFEAAEIATLKILSVEFLLASLQRQLFLS